MRPSVASAPPALAVVYGFGAYWVVFAVVVGVLAVLSVFGRLPVSALYLPGAALVGSVAAVAIAMRSGGWSATIGVAVLFLAELLVNEARGANCRGLLPGCSFDLSRAAQGHIAELVGGVTGVAAAWVVRRRGGTSAALLAAGLIALALQVAIAAVSSLPPATGEPAYERYLWTIRAEAIACLAGGAVIAAYARRPVLALLALGAAFVLPWSGGTFRQWWQDEQSLQAFGVHRSFALVLQTEWQLFLPVIYFVLVLIGFAATAGMRSVQRWKRRGRDA